MKVVSMIVEKHQHQASNRSLQCIEVIRGKLKINESVFSSLCVLSQQQVFVIQVTVVWSQQKNVNIKKLSTNNILHYKIIGLEFYQYFVFRTF